MIDLHCHILPGADDGPKVMEESIAMAKAALEQGIHTIVATPHHQNGRYLNDKEAVLAKVKELNEVLQERGVPLQILSGQEVRIHGELIKELRQGKVMGVAEKSNYLFIELPPDHFPRFASQMLFDLQLEGYRPVIVHPERNREIMENPLMLYNMVKKGIFTQVTAASVAGKFGKKIQTFSHQLIDANLTHFIASDAHNTTNRGFCLQEAYEVVDRQFGVSTRVMLMENAELLLEGLYINAMEPEAVRKKKFLGLF
ncbi:tyrosine protein phosphatase [Compostibacillus humi]|uniref:Tyrosine-protein phosphatase n=1 Tax=Compostibacillus humi TaxID=1245525 RepID=A0A8J2XIJ5_9BACI|nr:CpsB/CapC family capsule biosynthesis tyrosine phosphatase [Compostibacillus humi]GFZ80009.1 tyrosine protein phosphatase [Compostibacillus humi]